MNFIRNLTAVAAILLISSATRAQNLYGAGGLFLNPTASFAAKGSLTPSFLTIGQSNPNGPGSTLQTYYGVAYGATDDLEIGGAYLKLSPGGNKPDASYGVFAKYRLVEGKLGGRPDIAVGGNYVAGGDLDATTAFLAARYTPRTSFHEKHPIHLHGGLLYADEYYGIKLKTAVLYGGIDIGLTPKFSAFAEVRARMNADGGGVGDVAAPTAVGLVWRPNSNYTVALAYGKNGRSRENKLGIGVGFTLGTQGGSGERRAQ